MAARTKTAKAKTRRKPLGEYARKRDFARTPEPKPEPPPYPPPQAGEGKSIFPPPLAGEGREGATGAFVVQKHAARRLHYDLRLELEGVLKSWAVTRGPSLTLGEKRLAVRTEDHPIEYLDFEGNIPKGEYGGGSMIVWDRGRWFPEGDPHKGLTKGHLAFRLDGARLVLLAHAEAGTPRQLGVLPVQAQAPGEALRRAEAETVPIATSARASETGARSAAKTKDRSARRSGQS